MPIRNLTAAVLLAAVLPLGLHGQVPADSVHLRNNCRLAEQVLSTGHPAPHWSWALTTIARCRTGGPALASAIRGTRTSTDTALLNAVTRPSSQLRDKVVYEAALSIASDRTASTPARVFAIRTLLWAFIPGSWITYSNLVGSPESGACYGGGQPLHSYVVVGERLPSDYARRVNDLGLRVARDTSEPSEVRAAAGCAALIRTPALIEERHGSGEVVRPRH